MGNLLSKLFGNNVKEGLSNGNNNLGNVLIGIKNNDYTKIYSKSGNVLNITINKKDGDGVKTLIQDGELKIKPQTQVLTTTSIPTTTTTTNRQDTAMLGNTSVNIGDINVPNLLGGVHGGIFYPQYP